MKLWLSKNSGVPMKDQLITQIILGIVSGDLDSEKRLPSRQEIAHRFDIHANTVSNAYQELTDRGLIDFRQGSGFFVKDTIPENLDSTVELDTVISRFFQEAESYGFSRDEISEGLQRRLSATESDNYLVIEPDSQLRAIVVSEIREATGSKVYGISLEDFEQEKREIDANFVAMLDEKPRILPLLPSDKICVFLKSGSVPSAMVGETRPSEDSLIAIVSGWEKFLSYAKTILIAAQIDPDTILQRPTTVQGWERGLENCAIVICDSLTAKSIPRINNVRTFHVVSKESLMVLSGDREEDD